LCGNEELTGIIGFCTSYEKVINVFLTIISLGISIWALVMSILTTRRQNQIALLEKRIGIYEEVVKIYTILKNYPKQAKDSNYIRKLSVAVSFLFTLKSKEELLCTKIINLKKEEQKIRDRNEKEKIQKKCEKAIDGLVDYIINQIDTMERLKTEVHLLYNDEIEETLKCIVDVYRDFILGFMVMNDKELTEIIEDMRVVINQAEKGKFMEKLQKHTLKK